MIDIQNGLGLKNMSDLVRKKYMVFLVPINLRVSRSKNINVLYKN